MVTLKKLLKYYSWGGRFLTDKYQIEGKLKTQMEFTKQPYRHEILNYLLQTLKRQTYYLEIGVRNPNDNFNLIKSDFKYSVDPGLEFKENPVDFILTSDEFFMKLRNNEILNTELKFDVIFIDGLHTAEQVDSDIHNAMDFIKDDGFIVVHDCNPPTEYHAREEYGYELSPAQHLWNGTTWKGYVKWRKNKMLYSCTIDTDWGVGIFSKTQNIGTFLELQNEFYEYSIFDKNRKEFLNLISFEELKNFIPSSSK
jgi:hypothetical protein